jgi:hypothetical protein
MLIDLTACCGIAGTIRKLASTDVNITANAAVILTGSQFEPAFARFPTVPRPGSRL